MTHEVRLEVFEGPIDLLLHLITRQRVDIYDVSLAEGTPVPELQDRFASAGYGDFKQALGDALVARMEPIQKRLEEFLGDPAETERLLEAGAEKAAGVAEETMARVRDVTGLGPRPAAGRG